MERLTKGTVLIAKNTIQMEFGCSGDKGGIVFTTGKKYEIKSDTGYDYMVIDDENEDHIIGTDFINENFRIS